MRDWKGFLAYVDVEERQDAELGVDVPVQALDVEPLGLRGIGNHVVVRECHALGQAGRSLVDSVSPQVHTTILPRVVI